ncbi:MAG: hypothetical protein HRU38_14840 [Saccharospirillaceae bacterium]|nr:hypothetical protein [Pseudomonadales bacterium]NRB79918.1 hypothetical protein [Saccharospirillaceae bacterium]
MHFKKSLAWMLRVSVMLLVMLSIVSCQNSDNDVVDNNETGILSISFDTKGSKLSRMLQPAISINASSYDISGVGPEGADFDVSVTSTNSAKIDFLRFGQWSITVLAKNEADVIIAQGFDDIQINVGETTQSQITLELLAGNGSFNLDIEWPINEVQTPIISALLKNAQGDDIVINLLTGAEKAGFVTLTADLNNALASGYYTLIVTVHDEIDGQENHLVFGITESVRIIQDELTTGAYSLTGVVGFGDLSLALVLNTNDVIDINIDGVDSVPVSFDYDSNTQFTAQANVDINDADFNNLTYMWYLNGQLIEVADSVLIGTQNARLNQSINGLFSPGTYRLDLLTVNADLSRAGSTTFEFNVTGNPAQLNLPTEFATVTGRVGYNLDVDGNVSFIPLLGAQVKVGDTVVNTDVNGVFIAEFVEVGQVVVEISSDDFFTKFVPLLTVDQQTHDMPITHLSMGETFTMDATLGGQFSPNNGVGSVDFGANTIVDDQGNIFSGEVIVAATALNPFSDAFFETFPGDFQGLTQSGDVVDILSFGILAVELTDSDGNPLSIADGQTAEIRIKVENPDTAPLELPLWHLDEQTGVWTEDGVATLDVVTGEYVGQVSHFSWWNFDYNASSDFVGVGQGAFGTEWIQITVNDSQGNPVANANVDVVSAAGFAWRATAVTNGSGTVSQRVLINRNSISPFYVLRANKNGLFSPSQEVRFFIGENGYSATLTIEEPQAIIKVQSRINGVPRTLINDGPYVRFGQESRAGVIMLSNEGVADTLTLDNVSIAGSPRFTIGTVTPSNIAIGSRKQFSVNYTGNIGDPQVFATITVVTNDPNTANFIIKLEAGGDLTSNIANSVSLLRKNDYAGTISIQGGGSIIVTNTATNDFALLFENGDPLNEEANRILFAVDLSVLPNDAQIQSVSLVSSTLFNTGSVLLEGNQGDVINAGNANSVNDIVLTDGLIVDGPGVVTPFNAEGLAYITTVMSGDKIAKFMLKTADVGNFVDVDMNSLQLQINYMQ